MSDEIQPRHRIDIPNGKPANDAADIVISTLQSVGMDVRKAYRNRMVIECIGEWVRGGFTVEQFKKAMRNLMVLNPALKASV